jgi:FMN phosphatase YigB (HAD superfamily)
MSALRSTIMAVLDDKIAPASRSQATALSSWDAPWATVRGVVFDAPDVLYDATAWRRWLWRLIGQLGRSPDYAQFCRCWDDRYLVDVHCGRRELIEALEAFLLSMGLTWGQIDEIEAACRVQFESELRARPLPGVVKSIARLASAGVPLAAWADLPNSGPQMAEFLAQMGLANVFCNVITSLDCESSQPESRAYQAMTAALALPPGEVLYVGHEGTHLAAAKAFGMATAAVNYGTEATADLLLTGCQDLLCLKLAPISGGHTGRDTLPTGK